MPYKDPEKRRAAARKAIAKFRTTAKGKATEAAYNSSARGKEVRAKINAKPNCRLARKRLKQTPKHIQARILYDATPGRVAARAAYLRSPRGKAVHGVKSARRRVIIKQLDSNHTTEERLAKFKEYSGFCAYFMRPGCTQIATSLDHVIPLAKGGSNHISNCVPACLNCNSSKCAKLDWPWKPIKKLEETLTD